MVCIVVHMEAMSVDPATVGPPMLGLSLLSTRSVRFRGLGLHGAITVDQIAMSRRFRVSHRAPSVSHRNSCGHGEDSSARTEFSLPCAAVLADFHPSAKDL